MHPMLRSVLTFAAALVVYYVVPAGDLPSGVALAASLVVLAGGSLVLGALIVGQARRELRAAGDEETRLQSLLVLLCLTVLVFALGYFLLETSAPDQFAGLETRTDALYFTVTTLSTIGMGDVNPHGQLARGLVTAQIVFNLVFVAVLVRTFTNRVQRRARSRR